MTNSILSTLVMLTLGARLCSAAFVTTYSTEFSSDPGWSTNNVANYAWNPSSQTFDMSMADDSGEYGTTTVAYDGGSGGLPFRFQYDAYVSRMDGVGNFDFGFYGPSRNGHEPSASNQFIKFAFDSAGAGYGVHLIAADATGMQYDDGHYPTSLWQLDTWYRVVVEYGAEPGLATATLTRIADNSLVETFSIGGLAGFTNLTHLGASKIGDDYPGGAIARGQIDNVSFAVAPEPGAGVGMLIAGALAFLRRRARGRNVAQPTTGVADDDPQLAVARSRPSIAAVRSSCEQLEQRTMFSISAVGAVFNPVNGHYYEWVQPATLLNWHEAKTAAEMRTHEGFRGHLATLTSQQEHEFVVSQLGAAGAWLGGFQPADTTASQEPDQNWRWVTGEAFEYTNWKANEPNNQYQPDVDDDEDSLHLDGPPSVVGQWNDAAHQSPKSFIVEYGPVHDGLSLTLDVQVTDPRFAEGSFTTRRAEPLQADLRVKSHVSLWLAVGASSTGLGLVSAGGGLPGVLGQEGLVNPDGEAAFSGQFRNAGDKVLVSMWVDARALVINILDLALQGIAARAQVAIPSVEAIVGAYRAFEDLPVVRNSLRGLTTVEDDPRAWRKSSLRAAGGLARLGKTAAFHEILKTTGINVSKQVVRKALSVVAMANILMKIYDGVRLNTLTENSVLEVNFEAVPSSSLSTI